MVTDAKNDLNRVGYFSEMGYVSIGDPYKTKTNGKPYDKGVAIRITIGPLFII